jgi:hypothetical protein
MIFLSKTATYIPHCCGNKDLPEDEQVRFDVHAMTGAEEEKFTMIFSSVKDGDVQKLIVEPKAVALFKNQVDCVHGVYTDEKRKNPVTTADEFIKLPGTYEYITETVAFIRNGLTESEVKN